MPDLIRILYVEDEPDIRKIALVALEKLGGFDVKMCASGMAIVSTRHCDIPGVVKDGITGWLADEHDVEGLVRHLRWLIENTNREGEKGRLRKVIAGADMFLGLSAPGLLERADVQKMREDRIVFAMARELAASRSRTACCAATTPAVASPNRCTTEITSASICSLYSNPAFVQISFSPPQATTPDNSRLREST